MVTRIQQIEPFQEKYDFMILFLAHIEFAYSLFWEYGAPSVQMSKDCQYCNIGSSAWVGAWSSGSFSNSSYYIAVLFAALLSGMIT